MGRVVNITVLRAVRRPKNPEVVFFKKRYLWQYTDDNRLELQPLDQEVRRLGTWGCCDAPRIV